MHYPVQYHALDTVRARIRVIEEGGRPGQADSLPFGIDAVDARLAFGGLQIGALHELTGACPSLNDDAAATLFAAALAARLAAGSKPVLWALKRRDLFAPALARVGLTPDRLIYAECRRDEDVLAVMEDGLRHGGLAAVVGETRRVTMTATRRLQLAAEEGQVTALMLKDWRRQDGDPLAAPSAAVTRWRIGCAPSADLPVAGIGRPRWRVELVRQRGGPPCQWMLEKSDEAGRLALPAEPARRSAPTDRPQVRRAA